MNTIKYTANYGLQALGSALVFMAFMLPIMFVLSVGLNGLSDGVNALPEPLSMVLNALIISPLMTMAGMQ